MIPREHPLRHLTDFRGRATRTDLFVFLFITGAISSTVVSLYRLAGLPGVPAFGTVISILLLIPLSAIHVRRLHDLGRRAWWLLLAAPGTVLGLQHNWHRYSGDFEAMFRPQTVPMQIVILLTFLYLIAVLLLPGNSGSNRYGLNPRDGPSELAA